MREMQITVRPMTGGYQIAAKILEFGDRGEGPLARLSENSAVCSTYQQIPARIKALVTVAQEHMCPAKKEGDA